MSQPSGQPSAKELVLELNRLFAAAGIDLVLKSLEGRLSPEQLDEQLGPLTRFVEAAVDPEVVIDFTAVSFQADYTKTFHGRRGWFEFWRLWFEPWQEQSSEDVLEEFGPSHLLQHTVTQNRGRSSGALVKWEGWNVWSARNGRLTRLDAYGSREEALEAVQRLAK